MEEEATLTRLLAQQQSAAAAQQRSLQQLITGEELAALGAINTAQNTKRIRQIETIRLTSTVVLVVGLLIYGAYVYLSIARKYADLIAAIKKAQQDRAYAFDTSAWFIPFAYEYPVFAGWRFQNRSFPAAVVYAWYTLPYSTYARADFDKWINAMFNYSQNNKNASGQQIMCAVGAQYKIAKCLPPCPGPSTTWVDYVSSGLGSVPRGPLSAA